jgi:DNA-binding SARP family transcriptional activator
MRQLRRSEQLASKEQALLHIQTLGGFRVWREGEEIAPSAWGREKALHLVQFLVTMRWQFLHKEQIIDRLWPELDAATGDRDFKVALNAVNQALEPNRRPRAEPRFIHRHGLAYGLDMAEAWVDADAFEANIAAANQALPHDQAEAAQHYQAAVELYAGDYLPARRYQDWTSAERERLQLLALGAMTALAGLLVDESPLESIRLAQRVLKIDPVWEDAYRVQMRAYIAQGNRPLALRTYQQCVEVLDQEFGVEPLPETQALYRQIRRETQ